jgi:hypothetical protein
VLQDPKPRAYAAVRRQIATGDLLLFRGTIRLIAVAGRSEYTHAAMAVWWGDDLFAVEVREWHGGRAVMLSSQVAKFPGAIDHYVANPQGRWPEFNRDGAAAYMRRLCGCPYGYLGVLQAGLLHLPLVRFVRKPQTDDLHPSHRPPFCSQACSMAYRLGGGVDPVQHLADEITEPADLARSPFFRFDHTLVPGE